MGYGESILRIAGAIVALVLVLFLAWLLLRWLNGRMPGTRASAGKLIQVLDRVATSRTSGLMLVRVQDKVLLVGYSDHRAETLATFEDPDGNIGTLAEVEPVSFADALKGAAKQLGIGKKGDEGEEP